MATVMERRIRGKERQDIADELGRRVDGEVRFDPYSRLLYSTDASIYQMEPVGVVIPRSPADVQAVVEFGAREGIPVLPRSGGTSLAGQTVNHAIVMDFSKYLNNVLEVNAEEQWARVQPGIILEQLTRQVSSYGLQYAPDPTTANRACVGGGIGNNTCGAHSVIYGKTLDHIRELDVILSDGSTAHLGELTSAELESRLSAAGLEGDIYRGVLRIAREQKDEIDRTYAKIQRRVSGYNLDEFILDDGHSHPVNLARMVVGSEGTLCVVTEAKHEGSGRDQEEGHHLQIAETVLRCPGVPAHVPENSAGGHGLGGPHHSASQSTGAGLQLALSPRIRGPDDRLCRALRRSG